MTHNYADDDHGVRLAELCAGYGGMQLALELAGVDVDLAWYAEIDPAASAVMEAHHDAPNLGDITAVAVPPAADIVAAGWPCQPLSSAGRRAGTTDERWIIGDVCRVAAAAGARWLILENVADILGADGGRAMAETACAMAGAGFSRWEWCTLRASDVGAPHRRKRWFCVAHTDGEPAGRDTRAVPGAAPRARRPGGLLAAAEHGGRAPAPDADGHRRQAVADQPRQPVPHGGAGQFGPYGPAVARWERILGRPAPAPTDGRGRLSPRLVEWMMGLPDGWVTGCDLPRTAQLRVLGNGVVPQQAAAAITELVA